MKNFKKEIEDKDHLTIYYKFYKIGNDNISVLEVVGVEGGRGVRSHQNVFEVCLGTALSSAKCFLKEHDPKCKCAGYIICSKLIDFYSYFEAEFIKKIPDEKK